MLDATTSCLAGLCFCLLAISAAAPPSTILPFLSAAAAIWISVICSLLNSFTSQARRRETAQETCAT